MKHLTPDDKERTIASVNNALKSLKTNGVYMEADIQSLVSSIFDEFYIPYESQPNIAINTRYSKRKRDHSASFVYYGKKLLVLCRPDFIVRGFLAVELKCKKGLNSNDKAQSKEYISHTHLTHSLLLHYNTAGKLMGSVLYTGEDCQVPNYEAKAKKIAAGKAGGLSTLKRYGADQMKLWGRLGGHPKVFPIVGAHDIRKELFPTPVENLLFKYGKGVSGIKAKVCL